MMIQAQLNWSGPRSPLRWSGRFETYINPQKQTRVLRHPKVLAFWGLVRALTDSATVSAWSPSTMAVGFVFSLFPLSLSYIYVCVRARAKSLPLLWRWKHFLKLLLIQKEQENFEGKEGKQEEGVSILFTFKKKKICFRFTCSCSASAQFDNA